MEVIRHRLDLTFREHQPMRAVGMGGPLVVTRIESVKCVDLDVGKFRGEGKVNLMLEVINLYLRCLFYRWQFDAEGRRIGHDSG